jgi:integrase
MTPQACTAGSRPLKRAGLPESIKLHELRHSAADDLYRETGDIVKAQKLLQESVATTRGYLHPAREDLAEALASMYQQRSRKSCAPEGLAELRVLLREHEWRVREGLV